VSPKKETPPAEKATPLASAIATVGALAAAFGGRLLLLEPPRRYPDIPKETTATTVALFGMLVLLLIISAIVRRRPNSGRYWLLTAAAAFLLFLSTSTYYLFAVPRKSFAHAVVVSRPRANAPGDSDVAQLADSLQRFVYGDTYARLGLVLHQRFPSADPAELVDRVGGLDRINSVWTADSLDRARFHLTMVYVAILLLVATAVFSVIEGVLKTTRK
jgi:hypothetical protein